MPRPPSLSPELLQTFVTMVRTDGDAMSASRILDINQPSMSKRLAILQHAGRVLQSPWLERRGKKWFLTEEGKRVLPAVEEILHRYRILTEAILETDRSTLSIACVSQYSGNLLREALKDWRELYPDDPFRLVTPGSAMAIEGVANGSYDLAVVTEGADEIYRIAHRPLHIDSLLDDTMVMVANSKCPDYGEFASLPDRKASPKSITRFPLLLPERETSLRKGLEARFREEELRDRLRIVMELREPSSLLSCAREGFGVAVLPRFALLPDASGMTVKSLPGPLSPANEVKLISRVRPITEEMDLTPSAMAFRECLRQRAGEQEKQLRRLL